MNNHLQCLQHAVVYILHKDLYFQDNHVGISGIGDTLDVNVAALHSIPRGEVHVAAVMI